MPQYDEVSILAGGWSASRYDVQDLPGFVIGVNDSAVRGRCDAALSMDRLWTEARWPDLLRLGRPAWLRRAALINIKDRPDWVMVFDCDYQSSRMIDDNPLILNGTNSGLCAVNLAFQMKPKVLRLYGMDLQVGPRGQRHWYPDYAWNKKGTGSGKFNQWRRDLDQALKQCRAAGIETRMML